MILVDYMYDFIEVAKLKYEATYTVIEACKEVFARHGIPRVLHSDALPIMSVPNSENLLLSGDSLTLRCHPTAP